MPSETLMKRREFLRLAGIAAGAAAFPFDRAFALPRASGASVIVVGAGLAGLTAAYELMLRGHQVMVLEARQRVGGRVFTLRSHFDENLYCELGGEWIHPQDHYIKHYAKGFGLGLSPDEGPMAFWDGKALVPAEEAEKRVAGLAELDRKVDEHIAKIRILENPAHSALHALDAMSYLDWLKSMDATSEAIASHRVTVNDLMTVDIGEISALHMLYEHALPRPEATDVRIRGGNSGLPETFARKLGARVRTGIAVDKVEHDGRGVRVHYRERAAPGTAVADRVVLAIPGHFIKSLIFQPALPEEPRRAYATLKHGRIMKVAQQSRTRFWDRGAVPCRAVFTHDESDYVYDATRGQRGTRGILTCYVAGWGADRWGTLSDSEKISAARAFATNIWPAAASELERGFVQSWVKEKWSGGSYAYFAPGEMVRVRPQLSQPVDRIHFAGEHTAVWQGYMNGAVESGLRAAAEIDAGVKPLYDRLTRRAFENLLAA